MNAASFIDNPIAYDARVRAKDVGLTEMQAACLREAYGYLEPIDYIIAKSKFENAASNIELDKIDKVTELANVFSNPAKEIIDGQQLIIKACVAYITPCGNASTKCSKRAPIHSSWLSTASAGKEKSRRMT